MQFYKLLMDSVKLFFLNVFLYAVFLELFVVSFLMQERFNAQLPLLQMVLAGIITFVAITVWLNVATAWYHRIHTIRDMMGRAFFSELPFIFFLVILWMILLAYPSVRNVPDMRYLLMLFTSYMVIFPGVLFLSKAHKELSDEK